MTSVKVICYKSKILANGEHPLMIRVTKDKRIKYQSIGISIHPDYWDFKRNKPKNNYPNKDMLTQIILKKELEVRRQILELEAEENNYTPAMILLPKEKKKTITVNGFCKEVIEELKMSGKVGNARVYEDCYRFLISFTHNKLDIPFSEIDKDFLEKYEVWLRKKELKDTSMSVQFRTLRSLYNKAMQADYVKEGAYPFKNFKLSKFNVKTDKRAIPKETIFKIMNLDLEKESWYMNFSRDIFIFSYLCGGINMTDIGNLKGNNIVNNRLIYTRDKTGTKINIPLSDKTFGIINTYKSQSNTNYLFPFLNDKLHITPAQKYNRKRKILKQVNSNLKKIAIIAEVDVSLTTYVARHSYATVLKNSGVNIALIGETLGHTNLNTTQIYLDSFENSMVDKAFEHLL